MINKQNPVQMVNFMLHTGGQQACQGKHCAAKLLPLNLAESMLYKVALVSATLSVCSGFSPAPVVPRTAVMQRAGALFMQETEEKAADTETAAAAPPAAPAVEYSESLPMLVKRPQLKGYVGDVGFDPLGFSEILPMVRSCSSHSAASSPHFRSLGAAY